MTPEDVKEDQEPDNFSYNIIFPFNTYGNYGERIMMIIEIENSLCWNEDSN